MPDVSNALRDQPAFNLDLPRILSKEINAAEKKNRS
jgi:hypothetical protein